MAATGASLASAFAHAPLRFAHRKETEDTHEDTHSLRTAPGFVRRRRCAPGLLIAHPSTWLPPTAVMTRLRVQAGRRGRAGWQGSAQKRGAAEGGLRMGAGEGGRGGGPHGGAVAGEVEEEAVSVGGLAAVPAEGLADAGGGRGPLAGLIHQCDVLGGHREVLLQELREQRGILGRPGQLLRGACTAAAVVGAVLPARRCGAAGSRAGVGGSSSSAARPRNAQMEGCSADYVLACRGRRPRFVKVLKDATWWHGHLVATRAHQGEDA